MQKDNVMCSTDLIFTHGTTDRLNIPIMSKHTMEGRYVEIFNKVKHITVDFYEPHLPM